MLVLTRRSDRDEESEITIGDHIIVRVIEIRGDQVRLGITAPRSTIVDRREIWDEKQGEIDKADK